LMITMIAAPLGFIWLALGFVLFRFFDIIKPWPIRWLDAKVHGGFGIMIDDVLAGVFSLIGVQLAVYYL
jgi:phosphatidylglycerophosphatase A